MAVTAFEFDYRVREPEGPLGRIVESVWYARGTVPYTRERIAPTGSSVAVLVLGDAIISTAADASPVRSERGFIVGPHDRPVWNEPTGETHAVGIVTTPVGCRAIFGVAPASLRATVVDIADVWPEGAQLRDALVELADGDAMVDHVVALMSQRPRPGSTAFDRCERATQQLVAEPTRPIAEIADELGVSHAHLDRQFTEIVGLAPRALARLLRLRRLLAELDVGAPIEWSKLAAEYGWYDQAHFIRDFRRHTGVTPSEYVAAQQAVYAPDAPGDGAGFVPEVEPDDTM